MPDATPRRLVSAGAVLALHLAVISGFVIASYVRTNVVYPSREIEIVFPVLPQHAPPPLPATIEPEMLEPVVPIPTAPTPALPPVPAEPAAPNAGNLSGVGRALFGCDPMKLDTLSAQDRAACLRLPPGKSREQGVRLGPPPDPNSPFAKEVEERFREAVPINHPCPLGSYNDTHGLPCFDFTKKAPLLGGH